MKKLILTLCLSLSLVSNIFSYDEFLGLKGSKLDNGMDFDTVQKEIFDSMMKNLESIKSELTKEQLEVLSRYLNIGASRAVFLGPLTFAATPSDEKELYYIITGKDLPKDNLVNFTEMMSQLAKILAPKETSSSTIKSKL